MILLFKTYYVFWNSLSFGMSGMQYRAIACSVTLFLAILNFMNSTLQIIELEEKLSCYIFILWVILYVLGILIINSNKSRLLRYDEIKGKKRIPHILISLGSIAVIVWLFKY